MQQGMATVLHIDHGTSCSIITRMVMAVVGVHHLGSVVSDGWEAVVQVLTANLPVAIPSLDCDGDETSLLDCVVPTGMGRGRGERPSCATVLACGDTSAGAGTSPQPLFSPVARGSRSCSGPLGLPQCRHPTSMSSRW